MSKLKFTLQAAALVVFMLTLTSMAQAQATRTWVSGVGDDVNPCSRTAPCKTWAGAISKTAAGGEIDALDPGGFGTLTATKSITVEGTHGQGFGSTLNSGTTGFIINDSLTATPRTINVILRNLSINGSGTTLGTSAIRFLSGKSLLVENCTIQNQQTHGIELNNVTASHHLVVRNTKISNVGVVTAGGSAIRITGASPTPHLVTIDNCQFDKARNGIFADVASRVDVFKTTISNMTDAGVAAVGSSDFNVKGCLINHNTDGVTTQGTAIMRLSDNIITHNTTNVRQTAGFMFTYGTNQIRGAITNDVIGTLTLLAPANQ